MDTERPCQHCGEPIIGRRPQTKYCSESCSKRASQKRHRKAHPERVRERARWAQRKRKYGITAEDYDTLLAKQGGVCALCKNGHDHTYFTDLDVDHDHATGKVRGLLCRPCNQMLSRAKDDPALLRKAADYLES